MHGGRGSVCLQLVGASGAPLCDCLCCSHEVRADPASNDPAQHAQILLVTYQANPRCQSVKVAQLKKLGSSYPSTVVGKGCFCAMGRQMLELRMPMRVPSGSKQQTRLEMAVAALTYPLSSATKDLNGREDECLHLSKRPRWRKCLSAVFCTSCGQDVGPGFVCTWGDFACQNMRHQRVTSFWQQLPGRQEALKPPSRGTALKTTFRHCLVLLSLLLFAIFLLSFILKPAFTVHWLSPARQESVDQSEFNNFVGPSKPSGLEFMEGRHVVLVSHELSLSGGPLLLIELAMLLRRSGAHVYWVTSNEKEGVAHQAIRSLEAKLLVRGVQILPTKGTKALRTVLNADLVVLNTAVAGKWIDTTLKADANKVLSKTLWWIHEMRGHYFVPEYVRHLPNVAGVMIDSRATADYWQNRTKERLRLTLDLVLLRWMSMPKTYVVHLGNSQELTKAAEDPVARKLLRHHVRQSFGLHDSDVVFAMINSISRGKGQDLFLRAFAEAVKLVKQLLPQEQRADQIHALVIGSDWAIPKYETILRSFVREEGLEAQVHFVNKSINVVPYLAASDILIQNSQGRGECFGRITIEAMAFRLPVLGTAAGGTLEIVVNGTTGLLHPLGKEGVSVLAGNMMNLFLDREIRVSMGERGYQRVNKFFNERQMSERLGHVFEDILSRTS